MEMPNERITKKETRDSPGNMARSKSVGPDRIKPAIAKTPVVVTVKYFTQLFDASLN